MIIRTLFFSAIFIFSSFLIQSSGSNNEGAWELLAWIAKEQNLWGSLDNRGESVFFSLYQKNRLERIFEVALSGQVALDIWFQPNHSGDTIFDVMLSKSDRKIAERLRDALEQALKCDCSALLPPDRQASALLFSRPQSSLSAISQSIPRPGILMRRSSCPSIDESNEESFRARSFSSPNIKRKKVHFDNG